MTHTEPSFSSNCVTKRQTHRRLARQRRQQLTERQQQRASQALIKNIALLTPYRNAATVAMYWPSDGEISPLALLTAPHTSRKTWYLPILHPFLTRKLWFAPYKRQAPLIRNRFNIPEPLDRIAQRRAPWSLDLILLPLVCFDAQGGRIGMGGGFYDRVFGRAQHRARQPWLIGIAHSCQQVDHIPLAPWETPLDAVVTDKQIHYCSTRMQAHH